MTLKHNTDRLRHSADAPAYVVQVTDTHLFKSTEGKLLGVNTQKQLNKVLKKITQEHAHADCLLITGDIAQEYHISIYERFYKQVGAVNIPFFCLSGNHDDDRFSSQLPDHQNFSMNRVVELECWYIIMLNSSSVQAAHGRLTQKTLKWLDDVLQNHQDKHILIAMHHHCVPMKSTWLDAHILKNADDFWKILKKYNHVKAVTCGHVHQAYDAVHHGVRVLASPSTSVQFKPLSHEFDIDNKPSGFRWFKLFQTGSLETGVERLNNTPPKIDKDATGY